MRDPMVGLVGWWFAAGQMGHCSLATTISTWAKMQWTWPLTVISTNDHGFGRCSHDEATASTEGRRPGEEEDVRVGEPDTLVHRGVECQPPAHDVFSQMISTPRLRDEHCERGSPVFRDRR